MITQELVKNCFEYRDGNLYWKKTNKHNHVKTGSKAGCVGGGYHLICLDYILYKAHRLVFLYHKGYLPEFLDHIDGDKLNNKIENIRECTLEQNAQNKPINKANTSGVKGVRWHKGGRTWVAQIVHNKNYMHFGNFWDIYTAELTVRRERMKLHAEFCNHG